MALAVPVLLALAVLLAATPGRCVILEETASEERPAGLGTMGFGGWTGGLRGLFEKWLGGRKWEPKLPELPDLPKLRSSGSFGRSDVLRRMLVVAGWVAFLAVEVWGVYYIGLRALVTPAAALVGVIIRFAWYLPRQRRRAPEQRQRAPEN